MKVKIFQGSGHGEIEKLEDQINEWLKDGIEVSNVNSAMCQIGAAASGERYQHFVVTVWHE